MHPASYLNVFTTTEPDWALWVARVASILFAVAVATLCFLYGKQKKPFKTMTPRRQHGSFLLILVGLFVCYTATVVLVTQLTPSPWDIKVANMNADLTQKYHATLTDPTTQDLSDGSLTQQNKYRLTFSDGTKGSYYIKWDKDTSEPTIVRPSTPSNP